MCNFFSARQVFVHTNTEIAGAIDAVTDLAPKSVVNRFVKYKNPYRAMFHLINNVRELDIAAVDDDAERFQAMNDAVDHLNQLLRAPKAAVEA